MIEDNIGEELRELYARWRRIPFPQSHEDRVNQDVHDELNSYAFEVAGSYLVTGAKFSPESSLTALSVPLNKNFRWLTKYVSRGAESSTIK